MGWDAFGLPAENAAIQHGANPAIWTRENIAHMRKQIKRMGYSYDWAREVATNDPTYYKWKSQYAGMSVPHLAQLRELQDENVKLKRMYADLALMHHALKDVVERKL